jgi:hypothetical protein
MLYMFQVAHPPIIRSSKTVYTASGTCQIFTTACRYRGRAGTAACGSEGLTSTRCCIYSFWAPDDGRMGDLKHVENFTEINKLSNVASCWLYLEITLLYLFEYYHLTSHSHCLETAHLGHLYLFPCLAAPLTAMRRQNNEAYPFCISRKFIAVSSERGARIPAQIFSSVEPG